MSREKEKLIEQGENQTQLLVLTGPPCSGKTTFAKDFVKGKHTWIRINRDDIRLMCGDYWSPFREKSEIITEYEELMVRQALKHNYNVIIDATNLNPKTQAKWKQIASEFNANLKFMNFIVSYKEAIKRDKTRDLQVGEDTIRMFYRKYYPNLLSEELNEI